MSIKSAPYYWVVCDDCGRSPQDSSDYTAMSDQGSAIDNATDADYAIDGDSHYCDDCAPKRGFWTCEGCCERKRIVHTTGESNIFGPNRWCKECHEANQDSADETAIRLSGAL